MLSGDQFWHYAERIATAKDGDAEGEDEDEQEPPTVADVEAPVATA